MPLSPFQGRHRIRVVLSSTALLPFLSVRKAAALALAQSGVAAFFIAGVTWTALGASAGWFALAVTALAVLIRAIDIESWALLIAGGFVSRVTLAFGARAGRFAAAAALIERLLLGALAGIVAGHYVAAVVVSALGERQFTGHLRPEDLATLLASAAIGVLWIRSRIGRDIDRNTIARTVWTGAGILLLTVIWGVLTVAFGHRAPSPSLAPAAALRRLAGWPVLEVLRFVALGIALALPTVGSGEALIRAAHDFPPPRVQALRRTSLLVIAFALFITTLGTFLFARLVPLDAIDTWLNAPLVGVAQYLAGPGWLRDLLALALAAAALLMLIPALYGALADAERMLHRASRDGALPPGLASLHTRFGTPARGADVAAAATVLLIVASGGRLAWLAQAYAVAIATMLGLTIAALSRLRGIRRDTQPFRTPMNLRFRGREIALGLLIPGAIAVGTILTMLALGDGPSLAAAALIGTTGLWFVFVGREAASAPAGDERDTFDLLPAADLSLDQIDARPGNVLVPVRNPHALDHVVAALQAAGDRDVVVMTVRLLGIDDAGVEPATEAEPTAYERRLLSDVLAIAERRNRPVRLLIVPARNVVDAIVATVLRLRSSDVYVGESSTLSAADQARLLGDAWERAEKPLPLDVRLVIHHRSGRAESYLLGAHPPALTPGDLSLIHRVWLDAVKAVGPHVHHHDVVRAALTQMEKQLTGPERDQALAAIRETARPADELAAMLRARDYGRLRDMMRNRPAEDVAELLTALDAEDQVVVFRVLPRKDAAAVFEYLPQEAKEALLKAMAKEDVATLLNDMAPDDRTLFLEELPAAATRELLALLTPAERAVALTLLGYPERSVGRLMTPHYVAVRENWTVREVLDYVRAHGQDSETLDVIYVNDEEGLLVDDIRIRELLLAPLDSRIADLMDRRFVALKASDDQEAAVGVFRQHDRTALPVTDTGGMLIGIVTIDDILDVAEATTTREIQRIGGSEAFDEPYTEIAFGKMIRKRAGWLTALFLGEMLTATAMSVFEAEIAKAVVLALFVPLIISSGGNSGSQAATLVIRALALGEVGVRDWWRVMRREILAGLVLGAILGSIGFLRISIWSAFSNVYGPHPFLIALTVGISLVGIVLWGTLTGSLLPLLMRRLGFDPAASSAPFVATLVDVTGLVIYFSVALVILRGTVL